MMRKGTFLLLASLALPLGACGSDPEGPVEQIVVREPGEAEVPPAADTAGTDMVAAGQAAFAACAACHSVEPGGASGVGPNLAGVVGRKAGSLEGFTYSDAMKNSGITWTDAELDSFIADPAAKVPGTSMTAGAISDAGQRKAVIAYLASISE